AVISTAGNQLMGEAILLGKPMLVMPEDCVEQRMNAAAVERMDIGMRCPAHRLNANVIRRFLDRCDEFASNMRQYERDGLEPAVAAIERFLDELAPMSGIETNLPGEIEALREAKGATTAHEAIQQDQP